jgi:hypothetical protein
MSAAAESATEAQRVADPYDLGLLREEAARIKASLYRDYGDTIEEMYRSAAASSSGEDGCRKSQAEVWQDKIDELIRVQKPLRQQIKSCQSEAIQKLIDAAQDDERRGIDVSSKLSLLLSLQHTQQQQGNGTTN